MRSRILPAAVCLAVLSSSALAEPSMYGRRTVADITDRIRLKDCAGAVDDLKTALKKGFPEVALLAGSMYENGICVKRDWDSAVPFYIQAWQGGIMDGADRLAAGCADPEHGPDVAAALWWASRRGSRNGTLHGVSGCTVRQSAADDMDRFVAELQTWPQSRLQTCNYMVGVVSTISGEVTYPSRAFLYNVGGDVNMRFLPGVPSIEVEKTRLTEGHIHRGVYGDDAGERVDRTSGSFENAMSTVADRALRRYPHPDGIPADTLIKLSYHFKLQFVNK